MPRTTSTTGGPAAPPRPRGRARGGPRFETAPHSAVGVAGGGSLGPLLDAWQAAGERGTTTRRGAQPVPDVVAALVGPGATAGPGAAEAAERYGVDLDRVIAGEKVRGAAGEVVRVPVLAPEGLPARFLLVGTGSGSARDLRRAGAALARAVRGRQFVVTTLGAGAGAEGVRAAVEGLLLGAYQPPSAGLRDRTDSRPAGRIELAGDVPEDAVGRGLLHASATLRARDLAETPSNLKNPGWMVEQALAVAEQAGLAAEVWDADRLAAEGFGGLLAVGAGSATPPAFVRLDHRPANVRGGRSSKPVVLVGKGITYDTGGISIKPRESMVSMKTDMSGAAAVLAVLGACREAGVRRPVTGLLPLAENAFGASSYRPADVVTVHGGRTVEIINTDAEGRMVLADALDYAAGLDPDVVVDIATLTGAATQGLGRRHAALYATDERLAAQLGAAGTEAGELTWRMPLVEDYRWALDSPVADLRHTPQVGTPVGGGSITAALFLREFTGGARWAHLDVAGTARADKDEHEITRGATGYGARLLLRWLEGLR